MAVYAMNVGYDCCRGDCGEACSAVVLHFFKIE